MTIPEIKEANAALQNVVEYVPTFVMAGAQFYRITAPKEHLHLHSDMTIEGMKDWRIIP